jgi:hypothetical protein
MRTSFRGKQDSFAVFQILWEPENTLFGRIGQTTFRKPVEVAEELFHNDQPAQHQHYQQQADAH